jgi:hypothetical protein
LFALEQLSAYYPAMAAELQSQVVDALARHEPLLAPAPALLAAHIFCAVDIRWRVC